MAYKKEIYSSDKAHKEHEGNDWEESLKSGNIYIVPAELENVPRSS